MCFINVHQCHVMQSVSLMFRHLWLTTSCSCLLEAEGCRGAVQRTALCHLRRAVPRLFPAQMEVNASLSHSWQDEIGRKWKKTSHSCQNLHRKIQQVLFCDVFMSTGDQTQHWSCPNGGLKEEAVHGFCTLNGSSHPQCCEEAIVAFMAVTVESFQAAGRIVDSPLTCHCLIGGSWFFLFSISDSTGILWCVLRLFCSCRIQQAEGHLVQDSAWPNRDNFCDWRVCQQRLTSPSEDGSWHGSGGFVRPGQNPQ